MKLTPQRMQRLFALLNQEMVKRKIHGEVLIFGGSALALVYNLRESTYDVDAIYEPKTQINEAVREVARQVPGLPVDWLNDGVKGFIYSVPPSFTIWTGTNLTVKSTTADYLLTMKLQSMRMDHEDEQRDIENLIQVLGLRSVEDVFQAIQQYVPLNVIPMRSRYVVMSLFQ